MRPSPQVLPYCLCDFDNDPVFSGMTESRFEAIQKVFQNASVVVLWVTSGAISGQKPLANVTVGLGRMLLAESPDLRLRFLDVDSGVKAVDPALLATLLMRLAWGKQAPPNEVLWTHEPQLGLRDDGALYIPRILPLNELNRRWAA